jgi:hypothetical protein
MTKKRFPNQHIPIQLPEVLRLLQSPEPSSFHRTTVNLQKVNNDTIYTNTLQSYMYSFGYSVTYMYVWPVGLI